MKKTCLLILILIACNCLQKGYETISSAASPTSHTYASLSDIAEEVVAIPLQGSGKEAIKNAKNVRQEGNDIFLISNETLYRFNRKGDFVCRITERDSMRVAGYVVNPVKKQLIVLGNTNDIFYYSYDGELEDKKKLTDDFSDRRMMSIALHKERIWTTEEYEKTDSSLHTVQLERHVVEYDTSFRRLDTHPLVQADLGRELYPSECFTPRLSVFPDSGQLYASLPATEPELLLRDSLFLKGKESSQTGELANSIPLFPLRFGSRLWLSTHHSATDPKLNYFFCYDSATGESWHTATGLDDNFYQTGTLSALEPIDIYNRAYCFCRSGRELQTAFPESAATESSVLFIVKLKA